MVISLNGCLHILFLFALNIGLFVIAQWVMLRFLQPRRILLASLAIFCASTPLIPLLWYVFLVRRDVSATEFVGVLLIVYVGTLGFCGLYTFLGPATADRSATAHML